MLTALSMLVALLLDCCIGWPDHVFRRIGHPVTWIGRLISALDRRINRPCAGRKLAGVCAAMFVIGFAAFVAWAVLLLLPGGILGAVSAGILAWPLVAAKSMGEHFDAVRFALDERGLAEARREVAKIVGRDPETLDETGVARAAIESLAENTSDGITAPLFWGVVFGLPGIAGYKAINTLDSMIGHKNERYRDFGWAAARIDDVANLIPARLTALVFAAVSCSAAAVRIMQRDAKLHRSPNAGWPEAAMAGALGVRLSGPRGYGGAWSDEPWVNAGAADPTVGDLARASAIYRRSLLALGVVLLLLAVV